MGQCGCKQEESYIVSSHLKHSLIQSRLGCNASISDFYAIKGRIGLGGMGSVYACTRRKDSDDSGEASRQSLSIKSNGSRGDEKYALKAINTSIALKNMDVTLPTLRREIECLKDLDHPYIVKCIETFESSHGENIFIIMERCYGGDLYSRMPYTEEDCSRIIFQVCSAIGYIHSHNIIHRDLKHENILFETKEKDSPIKIIDLGLAKRYTLKKTHVTGVSGTIQTMAPEVLRNEPYSTTADMWSLGVITYSMLTGVQPFACNQKNLPIADKRRIVVEKIVLNDASYDDKTWHGISSEGKNFVQNLLVTDPDSRLSAPEALRTGWLRKHADKRSNHGYDKEMLQNLRSSLSDYTTNSALKKLALMIIAHRSSQTSEINKIRNIFEELDVEINGVISKRELSKAIGEFYSEEELSNIFKSLDVERDDVINYTEFQAALLETSKIKKSALESAFKVLDMDSSGFISRKNLHSILREEYSKIEVDNMISEVDADGDGKISKEEFLALFLSSA